MYAKYIKRPLDIIMSLITIIIALPIFLIVGFLVLIFLGNPIIFKQERPGKNEKKFTLYKFRTMLNKKDENGNLLSDEKRLTKFGRFLRSTSLDELPELINILKGNMSFVGPRPLLIKYLPYYTEEEHHRHDVRPGLTGLAQVNGRNLLAWDKRFEKDLEYVNNITFMGDMKILFLTFKKVLNREDIVIGKDQVILDLDVERKPLLKKVSLKDIQTNEECLNEYIKIVLEKGLNDNIEEKTKEVYENMKKFVKDGSALIIGAFVGKKIIGFIWAYEIQLKIYHVNYFCVSSSYRNAGIGQQLLEKLVKICQKKNARKVELLVDATNEGALRLYQKNNFYIKHIKLERNI